MRTLCFALLILTSSLTIADDAKAIRAVLHAQEAAWNRGDIDAYMQGYWKSKKLRFASEIGYKYGWQQTLEGYKKNYPNQTVMGHLAFTVHDIDLLNMDTALVFGGWELTHEQDNPQGLFTLLFRKFGNDWKIVADHTSTTIE